MARYKLILAYDGTNFQGFQRQRQKKSAVSSRTVQDVVETALLKLGWQGGTVMAAGRTDSGVHASGQVVAFDLEWGHSLEELQRALNANLPRDVAARSLTCVEENFHPRYDAQARRYSYRLFCDPVRDPLQERFAWRLWPAVEYDLMEKAARLLVGTHDFAAFGSPPHRGGSTVRTVLEAAWHREAAFLVFEIAANAFLYHMVRRLVFQQVDIGQGKANLEILSRRLEGPPADPQQGLAPPQGLTLVEVEYLKR